MANQNKTLENDSSVMEFIENSDPKKIEGSKMLMEMMQDVTGYEPKMWGTSIVGFGSYHYKYPTGREGDMPLTGFSPRK